MFKLFLKDKITGFQRKRQAAPEGIETKTIKQIRKETKKKLGVTETEAQFKRRLKEIQENISSG
ncbi:MAG TPA: hypothetical protein V6D14_11850 [Coleofasciculaceae cyanobacterium]|jgi:hypothetical protein